MDDSGAPSARRRVLDRGSEDLHHRRGRSRLHRAVGFQSAGRGHCGQSIAGRSSRSGAGECCRRHHSSRLGCARSARDQFRHYTFQAVKTKPDWNISVAGRAPLPHASLRYQAGFAAVLVGLGIGALRAAVPFIAGKSRPWPSAGVDNAADDPFVRRLAGEFTADLAAAYALTLATGDLLDAHERGEIDRTALAAPIYGAKAAASRAGVRATSEIFALMGTRSTARGAGFDRFWRNARTISLHDPVDWKHSELGQHVLTGWDPPPGIYQ